MEKLVFYNDNQGVLITQEQITTVDLGTVAPASSDDTRLRIGNPSPTYQADDVVVTSESTDQLLLSVDGDTYAPAINLGDLPPSGISDPFYLRRITPSTAPPGGYTGTLRATPTAWLAPIDTSASNNIPLVGDPDDDTGPGDADDRPADPDLDDTNP